MHIITEEKVDFKEDLIKIDSLDSSKGILKIFINVNGENIKNDNEKEPNFYTIYLKDFEIKNEFQDLTFNIVNNIEINLSLKVKNIIERKRLNSRMNMFNKKFDEKNATHNIISTGAGVSIKDRLKFLNNTNKPQVIVPEQKNVPPPKKIKFPNEFANKFMSVHGGNNIKQHEAKINENKNEKENNEINNNNEQINSKEEIKNNNDNKIEEKKDKENKIEEEKKEGNEKNENKEAQIKNIVEEKQENGIKDEQQENNIKEEKEKEEIKDEKEEQKEIETNNNNEENEQQIKEDSNNKEEVDENNKNEEHKQEEIQDQQKQEDVNENQNEKNKEEEKEKEENNKEEVIENNKEDKEKEEEENKNNTEENVEENKEENIEEDKEEDKEGNKEDNIKEEINTEENKGEEENNNKEEINEDNKEENLGNNKEENIEDNQEENKKDNQEENIVDNKEENIVDNQEENKEDNKEENQKENQEENNEVNIQDNKENEEEKIEENNKEIEEKENEKELDNVQEEIKEEAEKEELNQENKNENEENKEIAEEQNETEEKENIKKEEENEIENTDNNKEEKNEEKEIKEVKELNEEKNEEKIEINKEEKNIVQNEVQEEQIKEKEKSENQVNNNKEEIQKTEEIKPKKKVIKNENLKRTSCMLPQNNFKNILSNMNNNKKTETNTQTQKAQPKKLDVNKFKCLIGSRLIGQVMKKPNELKKKEEPQPTTTTSETPKNETPQTVEETPQENKEKAPTFMPTIDKSKSPPLSEQRDETEFNSMKLYKAETVMLEREMEIFNQNLKKNDVRKSNNSPPQKSTSKRNSVAANYGFEVLDMDFQEDDYNENQMNEEFLNSMNYEEFLSELKKKGKKEETRETFCEGFFIASFPKENGSVIENSAEKLPASCGHEECSKLPSMKPEIIMRYPLKDTKNLELNNLAATICFPTGIKLCYSENDYPAKIEDYVTQITNQKGERYYMRTFHFYHKMRIENFGKEYKIHPLKHHLMKFGDEFTILNDEQFTDEIVNVIQKNLDFCQELGFRDIVYIPFCICLISKYPYTKELENCLDTIYRIMAQEPGKLNFEINELIMYLIHSVPIPIKNMRIRFYIPYNSSKMELLCPKVDDVSIMNSTFTKLFDYLSIDNIILVFRLLLSEKKILFIHDDYTELTNITNSFISLLYPFKWIHTYIPIMSDQMLKYLETFLPFLNGIHSSLMKLVEDIFMEGEVEDSDEVFLVYIKKDELGEITLSSSLKKSKIKFSKYIQNNLLPLPFEKDLKKELKSIESQRKSLKRESKANIIDSHLENKMRDAFIDIFVKMFHDYEKYIGILDEDVIFNKVLFMNNIKKDEKFYDEFIESQLFQQFTQNLLKDNYSYFNKKIKESKEKKKKDKKGEKSFRASINKKETLYLTRPDYLGIKENDRFIIEERLKQDYKINKNVSEEVKNRILENLRPIDSNKYINSNCIIYLIPEKKDSTKEEENNNINKKLQTITKGNQPMMKKSNTLLAGGELTEKQIEKIKDDVKEMTIKIFKSEIKSEDNKALKTEAFRNLETSYGRSFFVSLISNNSTNVISLQENSFAFLENLINGVLNSILKLEETEQIIEEIVILIRSTKFFEKEVKKKDKSSKKTNLTLFDNMKKKLQTYNKIKQANIWVKWNELDVKKLSDEEKEDNNIREDLIIKICEAMSELELGKTFIKKTCEQINKNTFEEKSEMYNNTEKRYMDLIKSGKFLSVAN